MRHSSQFWLMAREKSQAKRTKRTKQVASEPRHACKTCSRSSSVEVHGHYRNDNPDRYHSTFSGFSSIICAGSSFNCCANIFSSTNAGRLAVCSTVRLLSDLVTRTDAEAAAQELDRREMIL